MWLLAGAAAEAALTSAVAVVLWGGGVWGHHQSSNQRPLEGPIDTFRGKGSTPLFSWTGNHDRTTAGQMRLAIDRRGRRASTRLSATQRGWGTAAIPARGGKGAPLLHGPHRAQRSVFRRRPHLCSIAVDRWCPRPVPGWHRTEPKGGKRVQSHEGANKQSIERNNKQRRLALLQQPPFQTRNGFPTDLSPTDM